MAAHTPLHRVLVSLAALAIAAGATLGGTQAGGPLGIGRVFFPNPVAALQDQSLRDQKDADYAELEPAYRQVVLTHLDGSGFLRGAWANVVSETGNPAYSSDNIFLFGRHDDQFEQVMAYYWVTEAQKYIQRLGFGTTLRPINRQSQSIRINQWGTDNSYSWARHDVLRFGKGGVDDAEDAEVILHEYAHAMMDSQMTPFGFGGTVEAASIGEGFSDYWAVTVSNVIAPTPDPACVADWDSTSYTTTVPHCLRRVDYDLRYPDDLTGEVYYDGLIWSRALWDIRNTLGHVKADTIILEGIFGFDPCTTMPAAAEATVKAAERLYGKSAAKAVSRVFQARGILQ